MDFSLDESIDIRVPVPAPWKIRKSVVQRSVPKQQCGVSSTPMPSKVAVEGDDVKREFQKYRLEDGDMDTISSQSVAVTSKKSEQVDSDNNKLHSITVSGHHIKRIINSFRSKSDSVSKVSNVREEQQSKSNLNDCESNNNEIQNDELFQDFLKDIEEENIRKSDDENENCDVSSNNSKLIEIEKKEIVANRQYCIDKSSEEESCKLRKLQSRKDLKKKSNINGIRKPHQRKHNTSSSDSLTSNESEKYKKKYKYSKKNKLPHKSKPTRKIQKEINSDGLESPPRRKTRRKTRQTQQKKLQPRLKERKRREVDENSSSSDDILDNVAMKNIIDSSKAIPRPNGLLKQYTKTSKSIQCCSMQLPVENVEIKATKCKEKKVKEYLGPMLKKQEKEIDSCGLSKRVKTRSPILFNDFPNDVRENKVRKQTLFDESYSDDEIDVVGLDDEIIDNHTDSNVKKILEEWESDGDENSKQKGTRKSTNLVNFQQQIGEDETENEENKQTQVVEKPSIAKKLFETEDELSTSKNNINSKSTVDISANLAKKISYCDDEEIKVIETRLVSKLNNDSNQEEDEEINIQKSISRKSAKKSDVKSIKKTITRQTGSLIKKSIVVENFEDSREEEIELINNRQSIVRKSRSKSKCFEDSDNEENEEINIDKSRKTSLNSVKETILAQNQGKEESEQEEMPRRYSRIIVQHSDDSSEEQNEPKNIKKLVITKTKSNTPGAVQNFEDLNHEKDEENNIKKAISRRTRSKSPKKSVVQNQDAKAIEYKEIERQVSQIFENHSDDESQKSKLNEKEENKIKEKEVTKEILPTKNQEGLRSSVSKKLFASISEDESINPNSKVNIISAVVIKPAKNEEKGSDKSKNKKSNADKKGNRNQDEIEDKSVRKSTRKTKSNVPEIGNVEENNEIENVEIEENRQSKPVLKENVKSKNFRKSKENNPVSNQINVPIKKTPLKPTRSSENLLIPDENCEFQSTLLTISKKENVKPKASLIPPELLMSSIEQDENNRNVGEKSPYVYIQKSREIEKIVQSQGKRNDFNFTQPKAPPKKINKQQRNQNMAQNAIQNMESISMEVDDDNSEIRRSGRHRTQRKFPVCYYTVPKKDIKHYADKSTNIYIYKGKEMKEVENTIKGRKTTSSSQNRSKLPNSKNESTIEKKITRSSRNRQVLSELKIISEEMLPPELVSDENIDNNKTTKKGGRTTKKKNVQEHSGIEPLDSILEETGSSRKKQVLSELKIVQEEMPPPEIVSKDSNKTTKKGGRTARKRNAKEDDNRIEPVNILEETGDCKKIEKRKMSCDDVRDDFIEHVEVDKVEKLECFKRSQEYIASQESGVHESLRLSYDCSNAGRIRISGNKKSKKTLDNCYMHLVVLNGRCKIQINNTYQILEANDFALIPKGSTYSIANDAADEIVELYYCQYQSKEEERKEAL